MKAKKISIMLAVILGAGMLLAGITTAAPASIYLELQASGKGYEAVSDNPSAPAPGIAYDEEKNALNKIPLYAWCNRASGSIILAFYVAVADTWSTSGAAMIETGNKLLINFPGMVVIYVDSNSVPIYASGTMSVQFKLDAGTPKSAKLKSLGMGYWTTAPNDPDGNIQLFGGLKMKGKMVEWDDLPAEVQSLFTP